MLSHGSEPEGQSGGAVKPRNDPNRKPEPQHVEFVPSGAAEANAGRSGGASTGGPG